MSNRVVKPFQKKHLFLPFDNSLPVSHVTAVSGCSYLRLMEANRQSAINREVFEAPEAPPKNLFAVPPDYNDCLDYF